MIHTTGVDSFPSRPQTGGATLRSREVSMKPASQQRDEARDQQRKEERLDQVVARIREDARRDPRRYLRETEVPGGGE